MRDLNEYTDFELNNEQRRRVIARQNGLCDYCGGKPATTTACKFPNRHKVLPSITEQRQPRMTPQEITDASPDDLLGCAECDVPAGTPCKPDCTAE